MGGRKPPIRISESFLASRSFSLLALVAQYGFPGKLDFVSLFADTFDENLLAFLQFVAHVANAAVGDFGNVKQTIGARKDFDERAKIHDTANRANISLTDFRFRRQTSNPRDCRFCCSPVGRGD
jgi:hypothetical protein